ncbi:MAG: protein-methionine-sulfoxide reductase heme-binding subunit MsrQ [Rhodobacterales bacterium]
MQPLAQFLNGWLRRLPTWPVYVAGIVPAMVYFYWAVSNQLGADPLQVLERQLGKWALQLLILTLLVTPLRKWTGISLLKFRRAFGLLAFCYVCLHLLTWVVLDNQFYWSEILSDLYKRPYIIIGMTAFLALIPLAITSNNRSIRALGAARWKNLHRLSYVAIILGAVHYLLLVKAWPPEPILYVAGAILLVLIRIRMPKIPKFLQLNQ